MFNFMGLMKTLGIVLLVFFSVSFIIGFLGDPPVAFTLTVFYVMCYVLGGILAPIYNPKTPYTASYLTSITLTVVNFIVAYFILDALVFLDPESINQGLVRNTLVSLIVTIIVVKIRRRKEVTS